MPDRADQLDPGQVYTYALGLVHASACAPADMPPAGVAQAVNAAYPTGIASPWQISDEPFDGGEPNPSPCDTGAARLHYLMVC